MLFLRFVLSSNMSFLFTDEESWEAEGLKLDMIEPMRKWSVSYEGSMVHQVNKTKHYVKLSVSSLMTLYGKYSAIVYLFVF